jgi:hypothetical protein
MLELRSGILEREKRADQAPPGRRRLSTGEARRSRCSGTQPSHATPTNSRTSRARGAHALQFTAVGGPASRIALRNQRVMPDRSASRNANAPQSASGFGSRCTRRPVSGNRARRFHGNGMRATSAQLQRSNIDEVQRTRSVSSARDPRASAPRRVHRNAMCDRRVHVDIAPLVSNDLQSACARQPRLFGAR